MYIPITIPIPNWKSREFSIPIPNQCGDSPSKRGRVRIIPTGTGLFVISSRGFGAVMSEFKWGERKSGWIVKGGVWESALGVRWGIFFLNVVSFFFSEKRGRNRNGVWGNKKLTFLTKNGPKKRSKNIFFS